MAKLAVLSRILAHGLVSVALALGFGAVTGCAPPTPTPCTTDADCGFCYERCDTSVGLCMHDDTSPCAFPETCDEYARACIECVYDAECDDADACTDDTCGADGNCVSTPTAAANACDASDLCNPETCESVTGICVATAMCDSTAEVCDPADGSCTDLCSADSDCDLCAGETCGGGDCVAGTPMDCDDGLPCTDDVCEDGICSNNTVNCADGGDCDATGDCVSEGTPTTVARVLGDSTAIGIVATQENGDNLALFGDKDASGTLIGVAGATFVDAAGKSLTIWFGPDGLPERAITGSGSLFEASNYSDDTVDITLTRPDGTTAFYPEVPIDSSVLARLRELGQEGITGPESKTRVSSRHAQGEITLSQGLEVASLALTLGSWTSCGGDIATALSVVFAPTGIPSAILSCASALLDTYSRITGNEAAAEAASTLSTVSCFIPSIGSLGSCVSVGVGVGLGMVQEAVVTAEAVEQNYCADDRDHDGWGNCVEACDDDPNKKDPGYCGCNNPETDSDGDSTPDCVDNCRDDPNKISPGNCGCGQPETPDCGPCADGDSDGDGACNSDDDCPDDVNKTSPGVCGCNEPETDSDGDYTPDCVDNCRNDPSKTSPGNCGCGEPETPSCGVGDSYEPDDNWSQATVITSGQNQTHSIVPIGDEDWVRFTLSTTSDVVIETSGPTGDTRIWLYDSGLGEIEFDDDHGSGLFSKIERDGLTSGTYYVRIDEFENNGEIGSYNINVVITETASGPVTVYLSPDADTFIMGDDPNQNHGSNTALMAGILSAGLPLQTRIRFNEIPAGADIQSATLRLYRTMGPGSFVLSVQLASRSWSEDTLTWNTDGATNRWTAPLTTQSVINETGYLSVDVRAHVQEWSDGSRSNYGFQLSAHEPWNLAPGNNRTFASREHGTTSYRPRLEIVYSGG